MSETRAQALVDWIADVQAWLSEHGSPVDAETAAERWDRHAATVRPVVTLFGAYDSGKSSLLRRLLVDAGADCPDWLTISARHETFEAGQVVVGGIVVQDTPGVSVEATDPRALANNQQAIAAAQLTDALVVVLPPQLATAELDLVRRVVDQHWLEGSLRFVISRFDEAGVDPTGDRWQYDELAGVKIVELRHALSLSQEVPVYVVAPDPWQLAGEDRQPDAAVWDLCRPWDGMGQLEAQLAQIPSAQRQLRSDAAVRYWSAAIGVPRERLSVGREESDSAMEIARQTGERVSQMKGRLDDLQHAAKIDLDAMLADVLDQCLVAGIDNVDLLRGRTLKSVEDWATRNGSKLADFIHDAKMQFERQLNRPNWADIELLLSELDPIRGSTEPGTSGGPADGSGHLGKRLATMNGSLKKALQEVKTVFEKRASDFSASNAHRTVSATNAPTPRTAGSRMLGKVDHALVGAEVIVALGPVFIEAFDLFTDAQRDREQQAAERHRLEVIEEKVDELRKRIAEKAFAAFGEDVADLNDALTETGDAVTRLGQSLAAKLTEVDLAHAAADALIRRARAIISA